MKKLFFKQESDMISLYSEIMNDFSDSIREENALIEGHTNFKQGLRARWEKSFTSVYTNLLVVYTDHTKSIPLYQFKSEHSWISSGTTSQNGLFVLNCSNESNLYLFEVGSDLLLRTWLQALTSAGWQSALVTSNVNHRKNSRLTSSNSFSTMYSNLDDPINLSNSNLDDPINLSNSDRFEKRCLVNPLNERSNSLPSLGMFGKDGVQIPHKNNDSTERPTSYLPLNGDEESRPLMNISESGYCSKESLVGDRFKRKPEKALSETAEVFRGDDMAPGVTTDETATAPHASLDDFFIESPKNDLGIISFDLDDPDATPKLEKKASMSQIIFSLKSKFGSASARKKGKKAHKKIPRPDKISSNLLWNSDGQWKDKWFVYQDGILSGYKDIGFKPADVTINVTSCTLTSYNGDDLMKRLNLFKLVTNSNIVHVFAAWTEEQYDSWVEILSFYADKKDGTVENLSALPKDSDNEDSIIPYERALSNDQRKNNSSSSENSSGLREVHQIDSVDSGNDGDESGLESSMNSFERRKRIEKERKRVIRNSTDEQLHEEDEYQKDSVDQVDTAPKSSDNKNFRLDFPRQLSLDSTTSTEYDSLKSPNSPTVEITMTSDENSNYNSDTKRSKRPSFILKQRWSMFEKNGDKNKNKNPEHLQISRRKGNSFSEQDSSPCIEKSSPIAIKNHLNGHETEHHLNVHEAELDYDSNSLSVSVDSPISLRQNYIDSLLRQRESSVDSTEPHWYPDASEDDNSDCYSVPGMEKLQVSEEQKQDELEDTFREETLLRKRRNSLKLERAQIALKIEALKETNKKKQEVAAHSPVKKEKIDGLEMRLEKIDNQIEIIDKRIDLRVNPTYKQKKLKSSHNKKPGNNIMNKLRGKNKSQLDSVYSMSVESLASNSSTNSGKIRYEHDKNALTKTVSISGNSDSSEFSTPSDLTGIQELMRTTQKLENSKTLQSVTTHDQASKPEKWRSKSVSSVDPINKSPRDINQNHTTAQSHLNHTTAQSQQIIEDFEKFSAMLTNQMKKTQSYHEPIDV